MLFTHTLAHTQQFYNHSTINKLGDGNNIAFWKHNWERGFLQEKFLNLHTHAINCYATVQQVLTSESLRSTFKPLLTIEPSQELTILQQQLNRIVLVPDQQMDQYMVKTAYRTMKHTPRILSEVQAIWKIWAPTRIRVFGWLICNNRILTIDNLTRRGWQLVNRCIMHVQRNMETVAHIFVNVQ